MAPAVCILNPPTAPITAVLVEDYDGFDPQRQRTAPSMRSPDLQTYATGPHPKAQVPASHSNAMISSSAVIIACVTVDTALVTVAVKLHRDLLS
jgi:hypothetical protein